MAAFENLVILQKNPDFLENLSTQGLPFCPVAISWNWVAAAPWGETGALWIITALPSLMWPQRHLSLYPSPTPNPQTPEMAYYNGITESLLTQHLVHVSLPSPSEDWACRFEKQGESRFSNVRKQLMLLLTWRRLDFPPHVSYWQEVVRERERPAPRGAAVGMLDWVTETSRGQLNWVLNMDCFERLLSCCELTSAIKVTPS